MEKNPINVKPAVNNLHTEVLSTYMSKYILVENRLYVQLVKRHLIDLEIWKNIKEFTLMRNYLNAKSVVKDSIKRAAWDITHHETLAKIKEI